MKIVQIKWDNQSLRVAFIILGQETFKIRVSFVANPGESGEERRAVKQQEVKVDLAVVARSAASCSASSARAFSAAFSRSAWTSAWATFSASNFLF